MIEDQFPEFYTRADCDSKIWQGRYLWSERAQLLALTLAALSANFGRWGLFVTCSCFAVATFCQLFRYVARADEKWWNGRAGAESVKTLSWRYVVGGKPFELSAIECEARLAERIGEVAEKVAETVPIATSGPVVSQPMRALRDASITDRVACYQKDRIRAQMKWYADKSGFNAGRSTRLSFATIGLQMIAMLLGMAGLFWSWDFDFVGVISAAAASGVAWLAVKQHEVLARSYAVASGELSSIDARISGRAWLEQDWAEFVDQSEEAISREHTSWRASRSV